MKQMDNRYQLWEEGYSDRTISKLTNKSVVAISGWRRRLGLPINKVKGAIHKSSSKVNPLSDYDRKTLAMFYKDMMYYYKKYKLTDAGVLIDWWRDECFSEKYRTHEAKSYTNYVPR